MEAKCIFFRNSSLVFMSTYIFVLTAGVVREGASGIKSGKNYNSCATIDRHTEKEDLEEIGQIVMHMEGPHEIPHRVYFMKDAGNECFKDGDFTQASRLYMSAIELLCLSCGESQIDEENIKPLAMTLNLNGRLQPREEDKENRICYERHQIYGNAIKETVGGN
ncbi:hypothetical protein Cgig2_007552 [Carnegiea gigantea]|uniref:Uncharacterized protein n=1 Tax=Carnegiea gigantea TaxID=171969 RepID=A0A9Q1QCL7_9CARY|nr:hypothetical protein Cgig2_007552 [Carnegiea gigantea]